MWFVSPQPLDQGQGPADPASQRTEGQVYGARGSHRVAGEGSGDWTQTGDATGAATGESRAGDGSSAGTGRVGWGAPVFNERSRSMLQI